MPQKQWHYRNRMPHSPTNHRWFWYQFPPPRAGRGSARGSCYAPRKAHRVLSSGSFLVTGIGGIWPFPPVFEICLCFRTWCANSRCAAKWHHCKKKLTIILWPLEAFLLLPSLARSSWVYPDRHPMACETQTSKVSAACWGFSILSSVIIFAGAVVSRDV